MAAAASSLEQELHCAVCLDFYSNPLTLPCQHSFCRLCISEVFNSPPNQRKAVICPNCRKEFSIGKEGVDQYPRNFNLANIVEKYRESNMATHQRLPCDLCEGDTKKHATKQCSQCQASYCESCFVMFHPMRGPLAKHDIHSPMEVSASARNASSRKNITCPDHVGKELDMFCVTCQRPICYLCDRVGGHHEHKVCDIQTAYSTKKVAIVQRMERLREKKNCQDRFLQELKKAQTICNSNYRQTEERMLKEFQKLSIILKAKEDQVKGRIANRKQQSMTSFADEIQEVSRASSRITDIEQRVQDMLRDDEPVAFLLRGVEEENSLLQSETFWQKRGLPQREDMTFIQNYDECLKSVQDLSYDDLFVVQPHFYDEGKHDKDITIKGNVMRCGPEISEQSISGKAQQAQVMQMRSISMISSSGLRPSKFRCIAILERPLRVGYNYVEFNVHRSSQSGQLSAAIAICHATPGKIPDVSSIREGAELLEAGEKGIVQVYWLTTSQGQLAINPHGRMVIKLDEVSGPGALTIIEDDGTSDQSNPRTAMVYPISNLGQVIRESPGSQLQPIIGEIQWSTIQPNVGIPAQQQYTVTSTIALQSAGTQKTYMGPDMGPQHAQYVPEFKYNSNFLFGNSVGPSVSIKPATQMKPSMRGEPVNTAASKQVTTSMRGQVHSPGVPSNMYLAFCLNTPGASIQVAENPTQLKDLHGKVFQ